MQSRHRVLLILTLLTGLSAAAEESFQFSSDRIRAVLGENRETTLLEGNARVKTGDLDIRAGEIEIYGEDFRYVECLDRVQVRDSEQNSLLECNSLFYDRREELTRVRGFVTLQDFDNNLIVRGGYLEDRGGQGTTLIRISVRIVKIADQKEIVCRSETVLYDRRRDRLELSGLPVVYWGDDVYRATRIILDLKTDEITLEGEVQGSIQSEKEEPDGAEKPES